MENPAPAPCLICQLLVPDELLVADSPAEAAAVRRYEAALIVLALRRPDHPMVLERRAAVAALLATAGRDGAAGVCR